MKKTFLIVLSNTSWDSLYTPLKVFQKMNRSSEMFIHGIVCKGINLVHKLILCWYSGQALWLVFVLLDSNWSAPNSSSSVGTYCRIQTSMLLVGVIHATWVGICLSFMLANTPGIGSGEALQLITTLEWTTADTLLSERKYSQLFVIRKENFSRLHSTVSFNCYWHVV